jgi:hypothetical protein
MAYRIQGLSPEAFQPLFGLSDPELAERGAVRMEVTSDFGFPCRITLEDRRPGETVLLVNHVSHDVPNPYRASHAIFVAEGAEQPAWFDDEVPPALDRRILSLRAFDSAGMMVDAALAQPGEADAAIRTLFERSDVASIHAHNAIRGCFAARIDRS